MEKTGASKSKPKSELVGFGGGGIFGDVRLVVSEVGYDFWSFGVVGGDLAEDRKAGTHTTFVGNVLEFGIGKVDIFTHFVCKGDNV